MNFFFFYCLQQVERKEIKKSSWRKRKWKAKKINTTLLPFILIHKILFRLLFILSELENDEGQKERKLFIIKCRWQQQQATTRQTFNFSCNKKKGEKILRKLSSLISANGKIGFNFSFHFFLTKNNSFVYIEMYLHNKKKSSYVILKCIYSINLL